VNPAAGILSGKGACRFLGYLHPIRQPEWSHLDAADSVVFTSRLAPLLRQALAR
jgi:hypothetical protein